MDFLNKIAEFMTKGIQADSAGDLDGSRLDLPAAKPTQERSSESIVSMKVYNGSYVLLQLPLGALMELVVIDCN